MVLVCPLGGEQFSPSADFQPMESDPSSYNRQIIHLSSYEDRDRGERVSSSAPRMLYDPKSGSMVAVPSREESGSGGRRKERSKKGRSGREKDTKGDARQDNLQSSDGGKGGRKGKGRKDDNHQRVKLVPDNSSPLRADGKKSRAPNSKRKLPRTCGVLYARDQKGNCYCADGCDGDLGYGAHSVPGGRVKNPNAFSTSADDQRRLNEHEDNTDHIDDMDYRLENLPGAAAGVVLQTGFCLPDPKEAKLDWVKPNEKIVLVTGVDDSPTLQATAKEWAPSRATLAAIEHDKTVPVASVDSVEDEDVDAATPVSEDRA